MPCGGEALDAGTQELCQTWQTCICSLASGKSGKSGKVSLPIGRETFPQLAERPSHSSSVHQGTIRPAPTQGRAQCGSRPADRPDSAAAHANMHGGTPAQARLRAAAQGALLSCSAQQCQLHGSRAAPSLRPGSGTGWHCPCPAPGLHTGEAVSCRGLLWLGCSQQQAGRAQSRSIRSSMRFLMTLKSGWNMLFSCCTTCGPGQPEHVAAAQAERP